MKEILDFLEQNKFGNLATVKNQTPDTRPMELVFHGDKGVFFYASSDDELAMQLQENPHICFCATDKNYNYIKVSGSVIFSDEKEDKEKILENSLFAKDVFGEGALDKMKVFYLPHGKGMLHYHADQRVISIEF